MKYLGTYIVRVSKFKEKIKLKLGTVNWFEFDK